MLLKLEHIYKDYVQDKLTDPCFERYLLSGRTRRICCDHGTFGFRKDDSDEYHRMS